MFDWLRRQAPKLRGVTGPALACLLLIVGVSCGGTETRSPPPSSPPSLTAAAPAISGTLLTRLGTIRFEGSRGDLIAFGPDGKTLLLGSRGSAIKLWDVASGRERGTIESGLRSVWRWALAPGGATIATVGSDGVRVHDLSSGNEVFAIPAQGSTIAVDFSPDGTMVAYAGLGARTVHFVDAATGQPRRSFPIENTTKQIGFSPDGRLLAVEVLGSVRIHDAVSGKRGVLIPGDIGGSRFAWSRDGKALARVDQRGSLRIVNLGAGWDRLPEISFGRMERGQALAFSPDGSLLALGLAHDNDGPVLFLVDTMTGEKKAVGTERHAIHSLAFSPDGSALATTTSSAGIRLWSVPEGRDLSRTGHESPVSAAAISADGSTLATGSADSVYLWRTADWELAGPIDVASLGEKTDRPLLTFASDGSLAAVVGRTVAFWDPVTRQLRRRVRTGREHAGVAALAPGARWLVAGSHKAGTDKPEVVRFDLAGGNPVWSVTPQVASGGGFLQGALPLANMVTALAVAPDQEVIAAGFFAGELLLLDARNGRTLRAFSREKERSGKEVHTVLMAGFSPDGRTLATAEINQRPELWEVATGERRCEIGSRTTIITGPSFSHDGKLIAASEPDGSISFFDVATCAGLGSAGAGSRSPRGDYAQVLVFAPSDTVLVSGHLDHTARVWTLAR